MSFNEELNSKVEYVNDVLSRYAILPVEGYQKTVLDAMNYSIKAGGKRLRPLIMSETFRLYGKTDLELIEPFMAALEMIHTYSLVHDDLPAMDNDEYRRGMKTTHIVYGEDMAILAGDALLNRAYEVAASAFDSCGSLNDYKLVSRALKVLTNMAGIYGMVGGQVFDVESENLEKKNTLEEILFIHKLKTSALLKAAFMCGAILADASDEDIEAFERIGEDVGIAFQIKDDILDVTSTTEMLGKPVGSDEKNGKTTYVNIKGVEESQSDVEMYSNEALELFDNLPYRNYFLRELIESLISREK